MWCVYCVVGIYVFRIMSIFILMLDVFVLFVLRCSVRSFALRYFSFLYSCILQNINRPSKRIIWGFQIKVKKIFDWININTEYVQINNKIC